ncbi:MAG: hypothetical protein KA360_08440, partial [Giesbergeria sp.]|nr:hypothetical protein [Giesbergeria sp.]MBP7916349.1 hypothetical protein [Giesbergeria sp.]
SFASTSSSSRRRIKTNPNHQDGFAVRALDPALNGRVCRAPDQVLTIKADVLRLLQYLWAHLVTERF